MSATNEQILVALRAAVAAKLAYWDANLALEKLMVGEDNDIGDDQANAIEEYIELAASCTDTDDVTWLDDFACSEFIKSVRIQA